MKTGSFPDRMPVGATARRRRHGLPTLLLICVALLCVYAAPTPWAFHIGDRFTPTMSWDGFGPVRADNGGRYILFTHLFGSMLNPRRGRTSCSKMGGCDTLFGTATLCSTSGRIETFDLRGNVHGWLSTDGAPTSIQLTGGSPERLPSGWVVALHGRWQGPDLELSSPDNSFTEVFTAGGAIRHVTSTADGGSARTTLRFGTESEFEQACRALANRAG